TAPANTAIYTLSLHDALPIYGNSTDSNPSARVKTKEYPRRVETVADRVRSPSLLKTTLLATRGQGWLALRFVQYSHLLDERQRRSEEHTSELQSLRHLVCRLL